MRKPRYLFITVILMIALFGVANANFSDINNHWSNESVEWAVDNDVAKGYPDGTFKPDKTVTEAEFLAMLLRAYGKTFKGEPTHWAEAYYIYAGDYNYPVKGARVTGLRDNQIYRTQVAEILAGTQGVNYSGRDAIHYLLTKGLAQGKDPSNVTIANYHGDDTLTRAEAVQFIKNVLEKGTRELQNRPKDPSPALPNVSDNDRLIPSGGTGGGKADVEHNLPTALDAVSTPVPGYEHIPMINRYISYQYNELFLKSIKIEENGVSGYIPTPPEGFRWGFAVDFEYKSEYNPNPARQVPFTAMTSLHVQQGEFLAEIPMDKITMIKVRVGLARERDGLVYYFSDLDVLSGNITQRETITGNIKQ